jgi:hypothetical protein
VSAIVPRAPVRRSRFVGWAVAAALMGGALLASLSLSRSSPVPPSAQSRVEVSR